ncbi:hypothetical protein RHMOL_Rhmol02G0105400 [Rhododendron molle]|uniref:Uncharacterized protein n=1 Tax=Rhododendron molle TaxID=49168 RepID=A0ACC0PR01_RHOML|nr:hypothetical protein RHMOL_Rhmol02G0105400 [Rhododendron molle]
MALKKRMSRPHYGGSPPAIAATTPSSTKGSGNSFSVLISVAQYRLAADTIHRCRLFFGPQRSRDLFLSD